MTRAEDLVDLIQTTNEIYLTNPDRNIRSAYIQIDDLCELIMKSYLQENVKNWSPNSSTSGYFKRFRDITQEIRNQFPSSSPYHLQVDKLLKQIESRRDNRNHFFHDHHQTGLTVSDEQCLKAFYDLYELMETLYSGWSQTYSTPNRNAQIAVIKLKLVCKGDATKEQKYIQLLRSWRQNDKGKKGTFFLESHQHPYEYSIIKYNADWLLRELTVRGLI